MSLKPNSPFALVLSLLLGGCSIAAHFGTATGIILDAALTVPKSGHGAIVISRGHGVVGMQCDHRLELDGTPFAELRPGETVTVYPDPGQHRLRVQAPNFTCGGEAELSVVVRPDQRQAFRTSSLRNGEVALLPASP